MKSAFAITAEYVLLRGVCAVVNLLPYAVAMGLARAVGWVAVRVLGFKRRRTLERLRTVFPGKSEAECVRIAVASLQNLLMTVFEMIQAPSYDRAWMDRHVRDGDRYRQMLSKLVGEGRGVVVMVPHSGNWYMAAWAMACYGERLFAIAARQRNPRLDAWMQRQYGAVEVLDRDNRDTLLRIREKLAAGRIFAILPDLRVRRRDVEADFFGGKANVSHAGAMFAVRAGAPIVVAQMRREGNEHVINYLATLRPDAAAEPKAEAVRLTREVLRLMDGAILERPGDWFWYNKRWILEPPTE